MRFKKSMIAMALMALGVMGATLVPSVVYAVGPTPQPTPAPTQGAHPCPNGQGTYNKSPAECGVIPDENTETDLMGRVKDAINVVLSVVGVVAVVVIIIGGISFITSQGDASKVTKARNTILYGVVGLAVALLAYAIVNFVLQGVFGKK